MPVGHLQVLFGEVSNQVLCPFLNPVVCYFDVELNELFVCLGN